MNASPEGPQINFELPPQPASPEADNQRQEKGTEAPAAAPEQAGKRAAQPVLPAVPDLPVADTPVIPVPVQDDTTIQPPSAHPAQDSERIEPVWVNKAKEIIARTHDDPYLQKDQMSKVKAEYIQKRFNKQIKTDEAPA
jgi:hypothetical protein